MKVHNLCRVKTKYLAISPVMDNFEQLDKDGWKSLNIKISRSKILAKENIIGGAHRLYPMVPIFEKEKLFY